MVSKQNTDLFDSDDYDIAPALREREIFVRDFVLTGRLDRDLEALLRGVGEVESGLVDEALLLGHSLRDLGVEILANHQEELQRLSAGHAPKWGHYRRWEKAQLHYYQMLLEQEADLLAKILFLEGSW